MSNQTTISWFNDFLGVAYRYYDLRMNVVPLFSERKEAANLWNNIINWWVDPSIRIRFVESGDKYWFIMDSESKHPDTNKSFYKILQHSENYERFKKGHDGEAYLRLGVYSKKYFKDVKGGDVYNCGHEQQDHDDEDVDGECLYEDCECKKFESFQVNLLKKKKTVTDIKFLTEDEVKEDPLAWNCLNANKYRNNN